ncbi:unnamed protein product [Chrysoparadoxa australica]
MTKKRPRNTESSSNGAPKQGSGVLYTRGAANASRKIKDKKLKNLVKRDEKKIRTAQQAAEDAEVLLPFEAGYLEAEGLESTYKFKQRDIRAAVDVNTSRNVFDLSLPQLGPYSIDFTRNGRWLLLGGKKGHLAMLDALRMDVQMEEQLKDPVRDVCALHNQSLVAVAQRKYVYIYDSQGAEVHCLRKHLEPHVLQFLPYHFLLASIGRTGYLKYQDVSTGELVGELRTKLGPCRIMRQNPQTAVLHAGHNNGVVTLWSPTVSTPLVRMLTHQGPVTALAVEQGGNYMVTSGQDGQTKVWDLRTYKKVHAYLTKHPPASMDISHRGLLGLGYGCHTQVWKDAIRVKAQSPYMQHDLPGGSTVQCIKFRPYEDVLGIGHSRGYTSMIVPGAGEPNFDSLEADPFQGSKARREAEVHSLLDKLQPAMINLEPGFIGGVDQNPVELQKELRSMAQEANTRKVEKKAKNKMRGRNKIARKLQKKQANVVDASKVMLREKLAKEKAERESAREQARIEKESDGAPKALDSFFNKKKR